jgi:GNAT superfamily N-acetyltransferase
MAASFRVGAAGDIAAAHQVFCRALGSLRRHHGFPWTDPPLQWFDPVARHLLATDPDRFHVAEVDGQLVGFAMAFVRDGFWFLSALFIDPGHQGVGIGRQLFERAAAGAGRMITVTDSIQPVSNALYARHGLVPVAPVLQFEGRPSVMEPHELEPAGSDAADLRDLDVSAYGFDRAIDHAHWTQQRRCTVWLRQGRAVAYTYRSITGSIGPLAAQDPESAAAALRAELARTPRASVVIPGSARLMVTTAVGAGLSLLAPPGLLLLGDGLPVPDRLAISGYFLY